VTPHPVASLGKRFRAAIRRNDEAAAHRALQAFVDELRRDEKRDGPNPVRRELLLLTQDLLERIQSQNEPLPALLLQHQRLTKQYCERPANVADEND